MCWKVYQNTHSCIRNQHTLATAQTTLNSQQAPAFASRHTSNRTPASSLPPGPKHKGRSRLTWIMHACRWIAHNHESCNAHDNSPWLCSLQSWGVTHHHTSVHWWVTLACRSTYTTRGLPQNRQWPGPAVDWVSELNLGFPVYITASLWTTFDYVPPTPPPHTHTQQHGLGD